MRSFRALRFLAPVVLATGVVALSGACATELVSPSPQVGAVAPNLICATQAPVRVTLRGERFAPLSRGTLDQGDVVLPSVSLLRTADVAGAPTDGGDPVVVSGDPKVAGSERLSWVSAEELAVAFDPASAPPAGVYDITVTNPDGARRASVAGGLAAIAAPKITSIDPTALCTDQSDQTFVLRGENFLKVGDDVVTVRVGESTFTPKATDCTALPGERLGGAAALCKTLTIVVPKGALAPGKYPVSVEDPSGVACRSTESITLEVKAPPTVTALGKPTVCEGGSAISVRGTGFEKGAEVLVRCGTAETKVTATNVAADGTSLDAKVGAIGKAGDVCEVVVRNPTGCEDRPLPHKTVTVTEGPFLYLVDPEVTYSGVDTGVQLFMTKVVAPATVTLAKGGVEKALAAPTAVPNRPNRLAIVVPKGLDAGDWDVTVADGSGCAATLPKGLVVATTQTLTLARLDPPFGSTLDDASITIRRDAAAAAPGNAPFTGTPRVYLIDRAGAAVEVAAVTRIDGDTLTAVVPKGTAAADYDVVVAGADGAVGVLRFDASDPKQIKGFRELAAVAPRVDALAPGSITTQFPQAFSVQGAGFAPGATASLTCKTAAGASTSVAATAGAVTCSGDACKLPVTVAGGLGAGDVCVVRVTNADGSYVDYSALGVTNPSLNLNAPRAGGNLVVGRRGLGFVALRPSDSARFLYALGGDDGTNGGVLGSVEAATVDPYGSFGAFALATSSLARPRAFAGTVALGRYVYVIGGRGPAGTEATVERALALSPREVPRPDDVDIALVRSGAGLTAGTWRYRISAVFSNNSTDNPGGESLPSDPISLKLPANGTLRYAPTLTWLPPVDRAGAPLPDVAGYRIYRTAVDGLPGTETLLATVAGTSFVDDGSQPLGAAVPVRLGALGTFATLASLGTPREALGVAAAFDPNDAGKAYVYALFGKNAAGLTPASYEFLPLTVTPGGHQTPAAAWTAGTQNLGLGRYGLGAFVAGSEVLASIPSGDRYIYAGAGLAAGDLPVNDFRAGKIGANGELTVVDVLSDPNGTNANYGALAVNGQLFMIGGGTAAPSGGARSGAITTAPQLANNAWNAGALNLIRARASFGLAQESAFVFLAGGRTDEPSPASKTTEFVIR